MELIRNPQGPGGLPQPPVTLSRKEAKLGWLWPGGSQRAVGIPRITKVVGED